MATSAVHAPFDGQNPEWMEKKSELECMRIWVPLKEVLTPTQLTVLLFICNRPRHTSGFLREELGLTKPSLSRHLSRLQQLGLVSEIPDDGDRRRKLLVPAWDYPGPLEI